MKLFGSFTSEDISIKKTCLTLKNTLKSDNYAGNALKAYLKEKNLNEDFQELADEELDEMLSQFWLVEFFLPSIFMKYNRYTMILCGIRKNISLSISIYHSVLRTSWYIEMLRDIFFLIPLRNIV